MKQWYVRAGSPRNRFQAFLCWCLGWDVYFGETRPESWRREPEPTVPDYPKFPTPKPKPEVQIPRERPAI